MRDITLELETIQSEFANLRMELELSQKETERWRATCVSIRADRDKWRREGQEIIESVVAALKLYDESEADGNLDKCIDILRGIALLQ